jgi:hypothetical protein
LAIAIQSGEGRGADLHAVRASHLGLRIGDDWEGIWLFSFYNVDCELVFDFLGWLR